MFDTASVFTAVPENIYLQDKGKPACLIRALTPDALAVWQKDLAGPNLAWMETTGFSAAAGAEGPGCASA